MQSGQSAPYENEEVLEAEVVTEDLGDTRSDSSQALVVRPEEQSVTLFGTNDPSEVVERTAKIATILKDILHKQRLTQRIGSSDHVMVEGWQTLGNMIGVFAVKDGDVEEVPWPSIIPEKLREQRDRGMTFGFKASYRAQTITGAVVGGGEAECKRTESKWLIRDDYALKSMAQTRAQSKALKAPLSFIVTMAGYHATPAEEMDTVTFSGYEAPFGPPMNVNDSEKLVRAMTYLTDDAQATMSVRSTIEAEAGGYLPRIVARSLLHIAKAARDVATTKGTSNVSSNDAGPVEQRVG